MLTPQSVKGAFLRMLTAIAAYVIKMQLKKKRGSIVCYDTPFFNLSEFYQVAMIILLPE